MMKIQLNKTLAALLIGLGSLTLVSTAAYADNNGRSGRGDDSDQSGGDDDSHSSSAAACSQVLTKACGLTFVKTTCTGASRTSKTDDHDESDEGDDHHDDKTRDRDGKNDRDYASRDGTDHSRDSSHNKITVCHRMGGASVTLSVANDGYLHGHSKHPLDSIGRCEDFDENDDSDTKATVLRSGSFGSVALTPKVIACLKNSGLNAPGVFLSPAGVGGGAGSMGGGSNMGSTPSRGSVRSVR